MPSTLLQKVWDAHAVRTAAERADAAVRRPAPDPRGHQPPGLRHAPRPRRTRDVPGPHDRDGRSHRADEGPAPPLSRRHGGGHALGPRAELPRGRGPHVRPLVRLAGHRPRRRAGARAHAAGDDDRLRRQPHLHARRVRVGGLRDRHVAGARRARLAVPRTGAAQGPEDPGDRAAGAGGLREGRHPRDHPAAGCQRRCRLRLRVRRRRHRPDVDGRADDDLQHVDRGRGPRRLRQPRPDDGRVPPRPPVRARWRRVRAGRRLVDVTRLGSGRCLR